MLILLRASKHQFYFIVFFKVWVSTDPRTLSYHIYIFHCNLSFGIQIVPGLQAITSTFVIAPFRILVSAGLRLQITTFVCHLEPAFGDLGEGTASSTYVFLFFCRVEECTPNDDVMCFGPVCFSLGDGCESCWHTSIPCGV